jgi:TnpA family transposase
MGSYVHVQNLWGISYDQPIILNEREAGPAIEGAIRSPGTRIEAVAVDSKGHTHFATGFAKALSLDLYPRLRNLKYQKLFVPKGIAIPEALMPIIGPRISLDTVKRDWDAFVRLAASVQYGWCSATMALRRYGSAAGGEKRWLLSPALWPYWPISPWPGTHITWIGCTRHGSKKTRIKSTH